VWSQKLNDMFAAALACMHCVAKIFYHHHFFLRFAFIKSFIQWFVSVYCEEASGLYFN